MAVDQGDFAALTLLDLSAAFDTVDHDILIEWLQTSFGVNGCALKLFQSYLLGRTQYVRPAVQYALWSFTALWCSTGLGAWANFIHTDRPGGTCSQIKLVTPPLRWWHPNIWCLSCWCPNGAQLLQPFLPRDALQCKARYCDRMSSVRLSVRL